MRSILAFYKALADESRLRTLRLLEREALNVSELTAILGLAQSTVSAKLGELRKAGLVTERREGGYSFYGLADDESAPLRALVGELRDLADEHGDLARLSEVLRERRDRGDPCGRVLEPGRSWVAWARALKFLLPRLQVADLGCGDGALTAEVAAWAASVVGVERDPRLVALAAERIAALGLDNVTLVAADVAAMPIADASVDLALLSHCLHFADDPAALLVPAYRVLCSGGRVLVQELGPHREQWVRDKLGHVRLGFAAEELHKALLAAGFTEVEVELTPRQAAREPFRILIASGLKL